MKMLKLTSVELQMLLEALDAVNWSADKALERQARALRQKLVAALR